MSEFKRIPLSIHKQKSIYIPALYSLKQLNKMSKNMSIGDTFETPADQFKTEYIEECIENKLVLKAMEEDDGKISFKVPTTTKINILQPGKKDKNSAKSEESSLAHSKKLLTNPNVIDSLVLENGMKLNKKVLIGHLQKELLKEVEQVEQKMTSLIKKDNQITQLNKKVKILTEENKSIAELHKINEIELTNENQKLASQLEIIRKEKEELVGENKCLLSEKWLKEDEIFDLKKRNDYLLEEDANNAITINNLRSELDKILKEKEEQIKKIKEKENKKRKINRKLQNKLEEMEKSTDEKTKKYENLQGVLHNEENKVSELELQIIYLSDKNIKLSELSHNYGLEVNTLKAELVEEQIKFREENKIKDNNEKILTEKCEKLQIKLEEMEKSTDEKTKKYENLQSVLHNEENKVSELQLQIIYLSDKNTKLSELSHNYGLEVNTLKAELVEEQIKFREENKIKDNNEKILIEKCEKQRTQVEEFQNLLRSEKDKKLELELQVIEITYKKDKLLELSDNYTDKINSMKSELETILKEKEELVEQNKYLVSDVSIKENEICDQFLSLLKENELNNKLQNKVDELKETNATLHNSLSSHQSVLYSEEKKVSGLELKLTELNQSFGSEVNILKEELAEERMNNLSLKEQLEILYKEKENKATEDKSFQNLEVANESNDVGTNMVGELILTSATLNEEANALSSETKLNALSSESKVVEREVYFCNKIVEKEKEGIDISDNVQEQPRIVVDIEEGEIVDSEDEDMGKNEAPSENTLGSLDDVDNIILEHKNMLNSKKYEYKERNKRTSSGKITNYTNLKKISNLIVIPYKCDLCEERKSDFQSFQEHLLGHLEENRRPRAGASSD